MLTAIYKLIINKDRKIKSNWKLLTGITILQLVTISSALSYTRDTENTPDTKQKTNKIEDLPWPVRIGVKIQILRANIPTVDMVMLVPDEVTFLAAMNNWSLAGRWPILIEDDYYNAMFIRRFKPKQVLRIKSIKDNNSVSNTLKFKDKIWQTIGNAWRSDQNDKYLTENTKTESANPIPTVKQIVKARWDYLKWDPPGVVITSINDPAWPGAVALAADRGQPIQFLDKRYARPNATLPPETFNNLSNEIEKLVINTGYEYQNLGDTIDTVTIALNIAAKYRAPAYNQNNYTPAPAPASNNNNSKPVILAATDGLARNATGKRWAIAGMIHGTAKQAVYKAMCAIFIEHNSALLYNSYPENEGLWAKYAMDIPASELKNRNFNVQYIKQPEAGTNNWLSMAPKGLQKDLLLINTKGQKNFIELDGRERVYAQDMPILNYPAAIYFIHSWSAFSPDDPDTIAGRWFNHGVYAYVGSVHEPYLTAFVPPDILINRLMTAMPFLVAARKLDNSPPWKINTFGDPLMTIVHTPENKRIDPEPFIKFPDNNILDLQSELARLTQKAQTEGNWGAVIHTAKLLGRDDLAIRIGNIILKNDGVDKTDPESALELLGPFFRQGDDINAFIFYLNSANTASSENVKINHPSDIHLDMLWAALTDIYLSSKINPFTTDKKLVSDVMSYIREPNGYIDACHIASLVSRMLSPAQANSMLDKYLKQTLDSYARKMLEDARSE